jgi:hypothetical protein
MEETKSRTLLAHVWFNPMLQEADQKIADSTSWPLAVSATLVEPRAASPPPCPSLRALGTIDTDGYVQPDIMPCPDDIMVQEMGSSLSAFIQGVVKKSTVAILKTPTKQTKGPKMVEAPTARRSGLLAAKAA